MTPQAALDRQIEPLPPDDPEQRLKLALDLHELACEVSREGIRHQFPEADEAEVERRLHQRLELARKA